MKMKTQKHFLQFFFSKRNFNQTQSDISYMVKFDSAWFWHHIEKKKFGLCTFRWIFCFTKNLNE